MDPKLKQIVDNAVSRRSFLAGAGAAVAGGVLVGCSTPAQELPVTPVTPPNPTAPTYADADYLNFALNLEYLEAEFYLRAATGTGLSAADTGNATSLTTGGTLVPKLSILQQQYIYEIAQNELDHVRLLRSALGSAAVNAPAIDLTNSFNTAAGQANLGGAFNPFSSYNNYLIGAFTFEDVGVSAYHGAAGLLSSKALLAVAAEIHAVEAYHAGSIRSQIVATDAATAGSMTPTTLVTTANAISTLRGDLGGGNETALSATSIVAADATNSIGYARTTDQVLHIVYGKLGTNAGYGVASGLFFPSGLNGNIKMTYS